MLREPARRPTAPEKRGRGTSAIKRTRPVCSALFVPGVIAIAICSSPLLTQNPRGRGFTAIAQAGDRLTRSLSRPGPKRPPVVSYSGLVRSLAIGEGRGHFQPDRFPRELAQLTPSARQDASALQAVYAPTPPGLLACWRLPGSARQALGLNSGRGNQRKKSPQGAACGLFFISGAGLGWEKPPPGPQQGPKAVLGARKGPDFLAAGRTIPFSGALAC